MRNRPFLLPVQKPDSISEAPDPGNLKNEFCGKILFRSNLYHLITGNLAVLESIDNKWFLNELLNYSSSTHDPNILKALKKIASAERFDESMRQRASEIAEIIDDEINGKKGWGSALLTGNDQKAADARHILAGIRYPQTTEVLRLMRDKSPELKRLALWLIGKFRMTDLSQEVCECLGIRGIEEDAFSVLTSLGSDAGPEIKRHYLTSAGNMGMSRAILRLFSKTCSMESMSFLVERLWSTSRQLREITLKALIKCGYAANEDEKGRLQKMILETFGLLTWFLSAKVCLADVGDKLLYKELDKEYNRWKEFLLNLLILAYKDSIPPSSEITQNGMKEESYSSIPNLTEIIFAGQRQTELDKASDAVSERKTLKKLQHYFPVLIPEYDDLLEDLINHDYNVISVWTKVCAIRSIKKITRENMSESVVALLFSPEEILREEATRLISRLKMDLYTGSSDRIHEQFRNKLDEIASGKVNKNELVYEKVKFLSGCFETVHEDELIYLAEKMLFLTNSKDEKNKFPPDSVIWIFNSNEEIHKVVVNHGNNGRINGSIAVLDSYLFSYVIPFTVIKEFRFQFPENSFRILRYIDKNEA